MVTRITFALTLVIGALFWAPAASADPVACESANAAVLVRAVAVVQAAEKLDASDATINDALLADVKAAGKALDDAIKASQALPATATDAAREAARVAVARANAQLQDATRLLNDAAPSPALSAALDEAKAALAAALAVQVKACANVAPPTTTTTAPPTTTTAPPDCLQALDAGRTNIPHSDPAYRAELDSDGDGVACETTTEVQPQPQTVFPGVAPETGGYQA